MNRRTFLKSIGIGAIASALSIKAVEFTRKDSEVVSPSTEAKGDVFISHDNELKTFIHDGQDWVDVTPDWTDTTPDIYNLTKEPKE